MNNHSLTPRNDQRKHRGELMTFGFSGKDVRVVMRENKPWWIASDVCKILSLGNPAMVVRNLDIDERTTINLAEGCRNNPIRLIVCESGLYKIILRSDKPEARVFQNWVTRDVLPAIRKTGGYSAPVEAPQTLQDTLRECANALDAKEAVIREQDEMIAKQGHTIKELHQRNEEQAKAIAELSPKAEYYDLLRETFAEIAQNRPKGVPALRFGGVA